MVYLHCDSLQDGSGEWNQSLPWRNRERAGGGRALSPSPPTTAPVLNQETGNGMLIWLPHFSSLLWSDCRFHESCASSAQFESDGMAALTLSPVGQAQHGIKIPGARQGFTSECSWTRSVFQSAHCLNLATSRPILAYFTCAPMFQTQKIVKSEFHWTPFNVVFWLRSRSNALHLENVSNAFHVHYEITMPSD